MIDYKSPKYDKERNWINQAFENGISWKDILFARKKDEEGLKKFLEIQKDINFWNEDVDIIKWKEIVYAMKKEEEQKNQLQIDIASSMILDDNQDNAMKVPADPNSSWILYKKHLIDQGFKDDVVKKIETSTIRILRRLDSDTVGKIPVKGLVIGNVQSGKTSNMAALMAMAADWGWNMFIVLSGTIESLRNQTQKRLLKDLNRPGNLYWRGIEHPGKKIDLGQRLQDLHFEENSHERYFTVCLKNAGRLRKLIQWLQTDSNKQKQLKILVIDDEADQAGINTADISKDERRTINKLIVDLVDGKNEKHQAIDSQYRAMNYIGYTATPYANILNENKEDSLYPKNFIAALEVSKEYFGPQQIFGASNDEYNGMNIVRIINKENLERIKDIHDGNIADIPDSLKDSLCWFLCATSAMRLWNYKKPVSMLVHSSQKQYHHDNIAQAISKWLQPYNYNNILLRCKKLWNYEINEFTFEDFRTQYPDYDRNDEEIHRYPSFNDIESGIKTLLSKITNIPLNEEKDQLEYHSGIHMCIDNCSKNGINDEGMYVRLAYPDSENIPEPAPAFIVIGGATLSRGLTIEGLVSTYFLRSVGQADTLMQMGRWFGYRKGYELLPRLWITEKTKQQFEFLADLDKDLRDEIEQMEIMGIKPENYGPKVKNTPKCSLIRITAKNRMQSAQASDMDYTGGTIQTYMFSSHQDILQKNLKTVEDFINRLGENDRKDNINHHSEHKLIWRNVNYELVCNMIEEYIYPDRLKTFNDKESLIEWIKKVTKKGKMTNWNIIVSGNVNNKYGEWKLAAGTVNIISRSQKTLNDEYIDIGVLSNPFDVLSDIELGENDKELAKKVNSCSTAKDARNIRSTNIGGLETTPQLIIYRVSKNSESKKNAKNRYPLNLDEDPVGFMINIPGGRRGSDYVEKVSIHINNDIFDDQGDLEGTNED